MDDDRTEDDSQYDRDTAGLLISIGLLVLIAAFFIGLAVYNEMSTPW